MDLFAQNNTDTPKEFKPLAERVRPRSLLEYVGQEHLVGAGQVVQRAIETDQLFSMLFWGPPAVGKTTLARIIASETQSDFHGISAVTAGVADLKRIIQAAKIIVKCAISARFCLLMRFTVSTKCSRMRSFIVWKMER